MGEKSGCVIGEEVQGKLGALHLDHPVQHGVVCDWDDLEKIWDHTFLHELCVDPMEHPVMLTEAPLTSKADREKAVQIMFESFAVPGMYVQMQAVLSLYAAGQTTGIVLQSGDGVTDAVPIYEGFALPHNITRMHLAGSDLTDNMIDMLSQERGCFFSTTADHETARVIKEKLCYVAQDYDHEMAKFRYGDRETPYVLPDGEVVRVGTERFRCPEMLFRPGPVSGINKHRGIQHVIRDSIMDCNEEIHRELSRNIVLAGGNTMIPGITERLQEELECLMPSWMPVRATSFPDQRYMAWLGGSILACLPTFDQLWISREEYEECGPAIAYRKCF